MEVKEYESLRAMFEDLEKRYSYPPAVVLLVDSLATENESEFPAYMRSPSVNADKFITAFSHLYDDTIWYSLSETVHVKNAKYYDGDQMRTVEKPMQSYAIYMRHKVFFDKRMLALVPTPKSPAVKAEEFVEGKVPEAKVSKSKNKKK